MNISKNIFIWIGDITLLIFIGFGLYFVSFWGLLGEWLMPRGTDKAKLEALEALRAAINVGMSDDAAKTAANGLGAEVFEANITTKHWGEAIDPKNFVLGVIFKRTSWVGPVTTNSGLEITIRDGVVTDVKAVRTISAP